MGDTCRPTWRQTAIAATLAGLIIGGALAATEIARSPAARAASRGRHAVAREDSRVMRRWAVSPWVQGLR